jgi:purine nucleosidase
MVAKPIIIDCDPGSDDAIALFLALATQEYLDILGIVTVAGNVPLKLTQINARKICELAGFSSLKVYAGCARPILRSLVTAEEVHGKTGLDGILLPEPTMPLQKQQGIDFLIQTLMQAEQKITLATLGPLTNLAVAMIHQPQICERIEELVLMGGAVTQGNITPSAEFNLYVDPHAAHVVFNAGIPLTMISLDITHQAIATPERMNTIRALNNRISQATISLLEHYGNVDMQRYGTSGPFLHDPCVIAYLLQPELFTNYRAHVQIEVVSELTMGRTVVDCWHITGQAPNTNVVDSINVDGFYQLLTSALGRY